MQTNQLIVRVKVDDSAGAGSGAATRSLKCMIIRFLILQVPLSSIHRYRDNADHELHDQIKDAACASAATLAIAAPSAMFSCKLGQWAGS